MNDLFQAFAAGDLTTCDSEPIHIPGSIQPHGALLALDALTYKAVQAGGATAQFLGFTPPELFGRPVEALVPRQQFEKLRHLAECQGDMIRPAHAFFLPAGPGREEGEVLMHKSDGLVILEIEPIREACPEDRLGLVQSMVRNVQHAATVEEFCALLVEEVRRATGFDRVMVYRFLQDGSGAVTVEARNPKLVPFAGLHYPASDIPKQARELYKRNWIRLIAEADYEPALLSPMVIEGLGRPLDLSHSGLRSVSPIHLEYLRNMGVKASLSLSLIIDGELWGLIACHAQTKRYLPPGLRCGLEIFSQMASFLLQTKIAGEELKLRELAKTRYDKVLAHIARDGDLVDHLELLQVQLLEIIDAGGMALWLDGSFTGIGETPKPGEVAALVDWLNQEPALDVYQTNCLPLVYPPALAFAGVGSGIIALSVSRFPKDYIIWFRPEIIETVTWGGNPEKLVTQEQGGTRISPRQSFDAWKQEVRFHSKPWERLALQTAASFRKALLEIVLTRIDQLARERKEANARQEVLLKALDERMREWEIAARELKRETDHRTLLESELSSVLRNIVIKQEAERARIARELHDSLGQYLTIMNLRLDGLKQQEGATEELKAQVTGLENITQGIGSEMHRIAWEIRPSALDDYGLKIVLPQYLEDWSQRSALKIDLHLDVKEERMPSIVETTLYRIVQEALSNVVKHAGACKVGIVLKTTGAEATLIIEDDGTGFHFDEAEPGGSFSSRLGLLGIRERLALVNGSFEIETELGQGTVLIIHVPLP